MIVREFGQFLGQPLHQVDADHRHVAFAGRAQQLAPAFRAAVEHDQAQVPQMRPGRRFLRPYSLADELGRDHQGVPAQPVANQLSARCERRRPLTGAEGSDQKGGVALVQEGRSGLLVAAQDAGEEGRVHCWARSSV
jgi:hypothetical protein